MNRRLAEAVVASFHCDDADALRERFADFRERDWRSTKRWLHTNCLALYFLERATRLGIEDAMPAWLVHELAGNLAENRRRTADLFEEFVRVNAALQRAGICYVNLKGFSLAPAAFADPAFRYMQDLDLLAPRHEMEQCRRALEECGYRFRGVFDKTWEYQVGTPARTSMRDLYCVRPVKTVEVHPMSDAEEARAGEGGDRISRMQLQTWEGFEFPALSEADKLLGQARHLFHHFKGEWTRTGWLLEYANAVHAHRDDEALWREAVAAVDAAPETRTGVAMATRVMTETFGVETPRAFAQCTVDRLPPELRLWVDRYRSALVLAEHPGSKLYLLLKDVLEGEQMRWRAARRKRLVPLHLPARQMQPADNSAAKQWDSAVMQAKYTAGRVQFHLAQGLRYKLEAARWRRFLAGAEL